MPRIIAVLGATGTQGSSIVSAILADPSKTFVARAITRNTSSPAAQALAARGVEVVAADLWDKASLVRALTGSEAVFGVTNYYDPTIAGGDTAGEIAQGKNLVDASKEAGVKFLVWSSLPHSTKLSNGKYPGVHHFDCKAEVEDYLRTSGLPHAIVHTGWFAENLYNFPGVFGPGEDGVYELRVPHYSATATNAITWIEHDLGPTVLALVRHYDSPERKEEVLGLTFYCANAHITYPDLAAILSKAIGKPVRFTSPPTTGMKELDVMYEYQSDIGLYRNSALPDPRLVALGVTFATLEEFAEERAKPRFA